MCVVKKHFSKILSAFEQSTGEQENTATRSGAGMLLGALQSFSFPAVLSWPVGIRPSRNSRHTGLPPNQRIEHTTICDIKLRALKVFLDENRDEVANNAVTYAKGICDDQGML